MSGTNKSLDRLVYMANQIALNLDTKSPEESAMATARHIKMYWDPRMKKRIFELASAGCAELSPIAEQAIGILGTQKTEHT